MSPFSGKSVGDLARLCTICVSNALSLIRLEMESDGVAYEALL